MSGEHTPGPWTVTTSLLVKGPLGNTLADCRYKNGNQDAHLIAAAPDMLEALEVALKNLEQTPDGDKASVIARAAIAKAKGGDA